MPVRLRTRLRRSVLLLPAIEQLTQHILSAAGVPTAEVSVDLVGDGRMRGLNRCYRGLDRTTDVLAFPMREAPGPATPLLGDVVISLETAARQAVEADRSLDEEMAALLIHGVLHLLGFDHERNEMEARRMRRKEKAVLGSVMPVPKLVKMPSILTRRVRSSTRR